MKNKLNQLVRNDEIVLIEGKSTRLPSVLRSCLNPLLPFVIVWVLFDSLLLSAFIDQIEGPMIIFIIVFFSLHLMPLWIYLNDVAKSLNGVNDSYYIVTNSAIYSAHASKKFNGIRKAYNEIKEINIKKTLIDKLTNRGTVRFKYGKYNYLDISSIKNFDEVFNIANNQLLSKSKSNDLDMEE